METKQCAVRGLLFAPRGRMPGGMCGHIIVGGERCGYSGQCEHKRDAQAEPVTQEQVVSDCYVISVHHTQRNDRYITIWGADNKGYRWALSRAGKYSREHVLAKADYYNSGCSNVAVPCDVLDAIAVSPIPGHHDNDTGPCVENTRTNWKLILAKLIAEPRHPPNPEFKGSRRAAQAAAQGGQ